MSTISDHHNMAEKQKTNDILHRKHLLCFTHTNKAFDNTNSVVSSIKQQ